ncbi:YfhO family protein, partial [bacterium]|nr:YfhO family protein [bacterium]
FQDSESFQGSVRIISKTPDVVNLQADFSSNGYLVIAENNFPGWHAEIDGKSAPILTANYAFQALALKQGKHAIKMEFRPAYYTITLFITITSFLIMITALIIQRRTVKVS